MPEIISNAESTISKNYSNIIMTIICGLVILILTNQSTLSERMVKIETEENIDIANMDKMNTRVIALERGNFEELQAWVEKYFARKPQEQ